MAFQNPISLNTFLQGDANMAQGVDLGNPFEIKQELLNKLDFHAQAFRKEQDAKYKQYEANMDNSLKMLDESTAFEGLSGAELTQKEADLKEFLLSNKEMLYDPIKYADKYGEYLNMMKGYSRDVAGAKGVKAIDLQYQAILKDPKADYTIAKKEYEAFQNAKTIAEKKSLLPSGLLNISGILPQDEQIKLAEGSAIGATVVGYNVSGDNQKINEGTYQKIDTGLFYKTMTPLLQNQIKSRYNKLYEGQEGAPTLEDFTAQQVLDQNKVPIVNGIIGQDGKTIEGTFLFKGNKVDTNLQKKTKTDAEIAAEVAAEKARVDRAEKAQSLKDAKELARLNAALEMKKENNKAKNTISKGGVEIGNYIPTKFAALKNATYNPVNKGWKLLNGSEATILKSVLDGNGKFSVANRMYGEYNDKGVLIRIADDDPTKLENDSDVNYLTEDQINELDKLHMFKNTNEKEINKVKDNSVKPY